MGAVVILQAKLLAEVDAMLGAFAQQKAAAVASAVGDLHGLLAQGCSSTRASFASLALAASSADTALKASPQHAQRTHLLLTGLVLVSERLYPKW